MNFLKQIQIPKYPIPIISIIVFIVSLILKFIELGNKSRRTKLSDPVVVNWLSKSHLGFLIPFMDLIGITQFSQPSLSLHPILIVIMVLGTFITMTINEIFYGRVALILLLLAGTMTISYISDLKYYLCNRAKGFSSFCCGSVLLYILIAAVINIILTNKSLVLGGILHILIIIALVLSDYYSTYKTTPKNKRLCLSINHHASMYVIGFIISLGLLVISNKSPLIF